MNIDTAKSISGLEVADPQDPIAIQEAIEYYTGDYCEVVPVMPLLSEHLFLVKTDHFRFYLMSQTHFDSFTVNYMSQRDVQQYRLSLFDLAYSMYIEEGHYAANDLLAI